MKTQLNFFSIMLVSVLVLNSCRSYYKVTTSIDRETDLAAYRIFAWLTDDADTVCELFKNEITRNNIRNSFGHSFSIRGYVLDPDSAELLLKLTVLSKTGLKKIVATFPYSYRNRQESNDTIPNPTTHSYRHHKRYFYPPLVWIHKVEYTQGLISIQVYERKKNVPVWSGTAKVDIFSADQLNGDIDRVVESIMKKYPVKVIAAQKQLVLK